MRALALPLQLARSRDPSSRVAPGATVDSMEFQSTVSTLQAARAYDQAARNIRGDGAICNFPVSEKEQANTARYLDRVAASVRKRRHGQAIGPGSGVCMRRLTARQRAKLKSQGGADAAALDDAAVAGGDTGSDGAASESAAAGSATGMADVPPSTASVLATKRMITKGNARQRLRPGIVDGRPGLATAAPPGVCIFRCGCRSCMCSTAFPSILMLAG